MLIFYMEKVARKTTLLHILSGFDLPTSGNCIINGTNITELSTDDRAQFRLQNIGMYIYQFFNLIPNLTLKENIQLPLIISKNQIQI